MDASEGGDDGERREEWGTNEPLESSWLVPREKQLWAKDSYGRCLARRRSHRIQQGRISFIFTCVSMTAYVVGDLFDDVATLCYLHGPGPV